MSSLPRLLPNLLTSPAVGRAPGPLLSVDGARDALLRAVKLPWRMGPAAAKLAWDCPTGLSGRAVPPDTA